MASYKLSELAEEDLRLISARTIEEWGTTQAKAYVSLLHNTLLQVANTPDIGRNRPELFDNGEAFLHNSILFITGSVTRALRLPGYCINAWTS